MTQSIVTEVSTLGEQKPMTQKHWIRGDRQRTEFADAATVVVTDLKLRQGLLTIPALKQFQRLPRPGAQLGDGKTPLAQFLAIRDAKAERLGREAVGGVNADKLKVVRPARPAAGDPASEWTVWLDPATALPVKIVSTGTIFAGEKEVPVESVFTDFAWNEKFADGLFRLDPPAGYVEGAPGHKASPEKTHPVGLVAAMEKAAAAKSVRVGQTVLDVKTGLPGHVTQTWVRDGAYRQEARQGPEGERITTVVDPATRTRLLLYKHIETRADTAQVDRLTDAEVDELRANARDVCQPVTLAALRGERRAALVVLPLPDEVLNGRKHRVYQVDLLDKPAGRERVWVDAETDLPSREVFLSDTDTWVTVFSDWGAAFDDKLFRTAVPAGYKRLGGDPSPEKTRPVSLKRAAELVAAASCLVVRRTQRQDEFRTFRTTVAVRGRWVRSDVHNPGGDDAPDPKRVPLLETDLGDVGAGWRMSIDHEQRTVWAGPSLDWAAVESRPNVRFAADWREDAAAVGLPDEQYNGRPAKVFRRGEQTVYLDAASGLPVFVVEVRVDGVVNVWDRFEWPAALDDARFRAEPPAGYTVQSFTPPAKK